jgi:hypothetical protein
MTGRAVVVVALLVLSGCSAAHEQGRDPGRPTTAGTASPSPAEPARRASSVVRPQRPVAVRLPSGAVVPVQRAGTTRGGLLDVPADTRAAGWWTGGSRVGDPFGSTLLAAHVDSRSQGLGPFAELLGLGGGERLRLDSVGLTQDFEVRSLRLVPQGPLTRRTGLFAPAGPRRLVLVTCAPPYVPDRGGYQRLAVVTARPVAAATRSVGR